MRKLIYILPIIILLGGTTACATFQVPKVPARTTILLEAHLGSLPIGTTFRFVDRRYRSGFADKWEYTVVAQHPNIHRLLRKPKTTYRRTDGWETTTSSHITVAVVAIPPTQ